MDFLVEKNIPLTPKHKGKPAVYPFRKMEVGDSFFMKGKSSTQAASHFHNYLPMRFTTRSVEGGVRVWRIK